MECYVWLDGLAMRRRNERPSRTSHRRRRCGGGKSHQMHVPLRTGPRAPGTRRIPERDQPGKTARLHHSDERSAGTPAPPATPSRHSAGTTTPPPDDETDPSEQRKGRTVQGGRGTTRNARTGGQRDRQCERGDGRRRTQKQRDRGEKTDVPTTRTPADATGYNDDPAT